MTLLYSPVSHWHRWQEWRWITTWKSWPTFSSSHSELIKFKAQNLHSVKIHRRSCSHFQRSTLASTKGNKELYLCSYKEKKHKYHGIAPLSALAWRQIFMFLIFTCSAPTAGFFCRSQVTGHRSQVIVLTIQKISQTLLKANLRPKNCLIRPN